MTRPDPADDPASSATPTPRLLVTAGPTWEPVDDVRFLGNRSSGRLGREIVRAAARLGFPVTLLRGPGVLALDEKIHPSDLQDIRFQTAEELDTRLRKYWPAHDILVMAAAVADHRPIRRPGDPPKRRRLDGPTTIELEPVPDLLAGLAEVPHPGTRIGFALEPAAELDASARAKLARKRLHGIVANPLQTMEAGDIDGRLMLPDGTERRPPSSPCSKAAFADWLVPELVRLHESRSG